MSIEVTVTKSGLDLGDLALFVSEEMLPQIISDLADICFESMIKGAPVRSGRLLMSIVKEVNGLTATVGPTVPYAPFVSLGTAPHQILPKTASVLAFPGNTLSGTVFAKSVQHPGTKPNPYAENAAADARDQVGSVFEDAWAEKP